MMWRPVFAFVDVFLRGDREKSFIALHSLLQKGSLPSSVLNMLLWQLRMLMLVSQSGSASAAGVKPFVYTKTQKALTSLVIHLPCLCRRRKLFAKAIAWTY